jgi:hypothetical protein
MFQNSNIIGPSTNSLIYEDKFNRFKENSKYGGNSRVVPQPQGTITNVDNINPVRQYWAGARNNAFWSNPYVEMSPFGAIKYAIDTGANYHDAGKAAIKGDYATAATKGAEAALGTVFLKGGDAVLDNIIKPGTLSGVTKATGGNKKSIFSHANTDGFNLLTTKDKLGQRLLDDELKYHLDFLNSPEGLKRLKALRIDPAEVNKIKVRYNPEYTDANAYFSPAEGVVFGPKLTFEANSVTPHSDFRKIFAHEFNGHGLQNVMSGRKILDKLLDHPLAKQFINQKYASKQTTIDDELLKLVPHSRATVGITPPTEFKDNYFNTHGSLYSFVHPKSGYEYFKMPSGIDNYIKEPFGFINELRETMIKHGAERYGKYTKDNIRAFYNQYHKNIPGRWKRDRILNFINPSDSNFDVLASVLNKLPVITGVCIGVNSYNKNDNKSKGVLYKKK